MSVVKTDDVCKRRREHLNNTLRKTKMLKMLTEKRMEHISFNDVDATLRGLSGELKAFQSQNGEGYYGRNSFEILQDVIFHTIDVLEKNVKHVMVFLNNDIIEICYGFINRGSIEEKFLVAYIMTNLLSVDNDEIIGCVMNKCSQNFLPVYYGLLEGQYDTCFVKNNANSINCTQNQFYELTFQIIWAISNYVTDSFERICNLGINRIIYIVDIINNLCKNQDFAENCLIFQSVISVKNYKNFAFFGITIYRYDLVTMCTEVIDQYLNKYKTYCCQISKDTKLANMLQNEPTVNISQLCKYLKYVYEALRYLNKVTTIDQNEEKSKYKELFKLLQEKNFYGRLIELVNSIDYIKNQQEDKIFDKISLIANKSFINLSFYDDSGEIFLQNLTNRSFKREFFDVMYRFLMPENSFYLLRKETVYMISNLLQNHTDIVEAFVHELSVQYQIYFDIEETPGSYYCSECLGVIESFFSNATDSQIIRLLNEYDERFFIVVQENLKQYQDKDSLQKVLNIIDLQLEYGNTCIKAGQFDENNYARIILNNNEYIEIIEELQGFPDADQSDTAKSIVENYLILEM